ncbi:MAG TPA: thymidylate kinase, partial [Ruminococcaceae bacterium]|nr:thymidylate kinase [Oscillospiraceae bacterium]
MEGKLIVIDGLDGSGKTTQINRLEKHFEKAAQNYKTITFPDYNEKSSTLVKMYLKGEIGGLNEVNAYA